jgi:hypothetical protein
MSSVEEDAMQSIGTKNKSHAGSRSIVDTITHLHREFANMKSELTGAHSEISRLQGELVNMTTHVQQFVDLDFAGLRREAAFYCHPDRGGNSSLMCKLNVLFDLLELVPEDVFAVAESEAAA